MRNSLPDEPFWIDEPNPYSRPGASATKGSLTWLISGIFKAYALVVRLFIFALIIFLAIKFPLLWIIVLLEAVILSVRIFAPRLKETRQAKAVRIQSLAKDKTGADYLGSAIHTAGHPLLHVNQPVVLALKDSELSIYSYENATPIDILSIDELLAVNPVVFDDDYIPHVGVIDNTAQALQISFQRQGNTYICSFRRMYKVRPIEWYQAIQKARFISGKAG
jgi:hypothetical protein